MSFIEDKEIIMKNAIFLLNRGYRITLDKNDSIIYENESNKFIIGYEKINNISVIDLCFFNSKEVFSIGWIGIVRNKLQTDPLEKLDNVLKLLSFVKENYENLTDLSYCLESSKMVEEYINNI